MMASPLLVVRTGRGMGLMPDPTVVAELELSVVDASSGGRPPHRWQTQKEKKKSWSGAGAKIQDQGVGRGGRGTAICLE